MGDIDEILGELSKSAEELAAGQDDAPDVRQRQVARHTQAVLRARRAGIPGERRRMAEARGGRSGQVRLREQRKRNAPRALAKLILEANWKDPKRDHRKAYILSCLSELSYVFLGGGEHAPLGRLLVLPSEVTALIDYSVAGIADRLRVEMERFFVESGISFEFFETRGFIYVVFSTDQVVLVAVRGTKRFWDWPKINLRARPLIPGRAAYHAGYQRAAAKGHDELMKRVRSKYLPIWVTGHSLGGAVAAIINQRQSTAGCYAFGSPRFANKAGVAKREPVAYVRPRDLVPHMPPRELGYADASTNEIVVGPPGTVRLSGPAAAREWFEPARRFAVQHTIEGYRRGIAKMMDPGFPDLAFQSALYDLVRRSRNVVAKA